MKTLQLCLMCVSFLIQPAWFSGCATCRRDSISGFEHSKGRFVKEGAVWTEHLDGASYTFTFREVKRDGTWLYLYDDSRNYDAKFPLKGGTMYLHTDAWYPYYDVHPVTE